MKTIIITEIFDSNELPDGLNMISGIINGLTFRKNTFFIGKNEVFIKIDKKKWMIPLKGKILDYLDYNLITISIQCNPSRNLITLSCKFKKANI